MGTHKIVGVIGEGKMGTNLFHYIAGFPYEMRWLTGRDADIAQLSRSWAKKVARGLNAGIISAEGAERMAKAVISPDPAILSDCDLVIEAIPEDLAAKQNLFRLLDPVIPPSTILSSNSSSILPSQLIPSPTRVSNTIGLHFFYPVGLKNIVELVTCDTTSPQTIESAGSFLSTIGRKYLLQDERGAFILNRVFLEIQAEAFAIVSEGIVTAAELDELVHSRLFPLGPFECADAVGIDVMLPSVRNYILRYPDKTRYEDLIHILEKMNSAGTLGVKSGRGFFDYGPGLPPTVHGGSAIPEAVATTVTERLKNSLGKAVDNLSVGTVFDKVDLIAGLDEYLGK